MSGRLASFKGPSTPNSSPARQQQPQQIQSEPTETTHHRKFRLLLLDMKGAAETWDDLVLVDGLKAAKGLVDARTQLDNELQLVEERRPRTRLVGPKLAIMESRINDLDAVLVKLNKQFRKMTSIYDAMESLLVDAHATRGWQFAQQEPLWLTWPLERFVNELSQLIPLYHRELNIHIALVARLRKHAMPFEEARRAVATWSEQRWLEDQGWEAKWEDLCEVEVDRWDI
ncbi:hypothetical protein CYLTODRAFT_398643 [Cylindrobasidium torrendii FP15055 ss-10]|uniref:Uncharacterized protein n=1 Tax=Cylindrobasidium torrendii FP15055 ss-10 TaxID=1314674 RepID=A0A0D7B8G0_9AGAR|nr:hypothetical protein CYLTODRAFT_398643 [Cylindrobasidium torrendii FP15055 ss-10]